MEINTGFEKLEWQAPEYEFQKKSPEWFWAIGIIVVALVIVSALTDNFLFGVFSAIAGFTLIMYAVRHPRIINFAITERGILIDKKLYPYGNLKAFWVDYNPPHTKKLLLESEKIFMPRISIPLDEIDPNKLREILLKFLKEKKIEESLSETIMNYFGF